MRIWGVATLVAAAVIAPAAAQAPSPADGPWSGQAQCVLVARGADYQEEITHTWRLTGEPAVVMGSTRHWPAVWSAAGRGTRLVRGISGSVPASDSWTINTPEVPGPIAVWQMPTTGNMRVASVHSPLVVQRAIDVTSSSGERIGYTLQEWAFPAAEAAATSAAISGTRTRTVAPGPGWRQPQMLPTTETCTWNFTRGGTPQPTTERGAAGRTAVPGTAAPPGTRAGVFPPGFGIPSVAAPPTGAATGRTAAPPTVTVPTTAAPTTAAPTTAAPTTAAPTASRPVTTGVGSTTPTDVVGGTGGTVLTNPTAPRAVPISATADLATTIVTAPTGGGTTYYHGDNVKFLVTATNTGPAEANGAVVGVPRDPTAVKVLVTCDAQNGAQCPPALSVAQVEGGIAIPTLPAGGSVTLTLFAQLRATGYNNPFTLASTVTPPSGVPDPNAANNSSRHSGPIGRRTPGSGGADVYTTVEPQPRTRTYWQPIEPARYRVIVFNSGQAAADNIEVTVPPSPGLVKTAVTCTGVGGGECPANLTVAQLERGAVVPRLAGRDGHVIIAFDAKVTGELGSDVSVTSIARVQGAVGDNLTNDNVDTRTLRILLESTDSAPPTSPGPPGGGDHTAMPNTGHTLSPVPCRLAGPALNPPAVSPAGPILTWPHINGARYTVSRSDMGVLTPTPLTAQFVPSTVTFAHSAPMYHHMTYRYSVTAEYGGGCGRSDVAITPPRPFVPVVTSSAAARGNGVYAVTLAWTVPGEVDQYLRENVGFVVLGPGLPPTGYDDNGWDVGCGIASTPDYCAEIKRRKIPPFTVVIQNLPAGEHTWIVTPYWETQSGRMIDVSSGARVTARVP